MKEKSIEELNNKNNYVVRYKRNDEGNMAIYSITGPYSNEEQNEMLKDQTEMIVMETYWLNLMRKDNEVYLMSRNNEEDHRYDIFYAKAKDKESLDKGLEYVKQGKTTVPAVADYFEEFNFIMSYKCEKLDLPDLKRSNVYYSHILSFDSDRDKHEVVSSKCFNEYKDHMTAVNELLFYAVERSKELKPIYGNSEISLNTSAATCGEIGIYEITSSETILREVVTLYPLEAFSEKKTHYYDSKTDY